MQIDNLLLLLLLLLLLSLLIPKLVDLYFLYYGAELFDQEQDSQPNGKERAEPIPSSSASILRKYVHVL